MQYTAPLAQTLPFFPSVLKTLSHPTSSTRPLVYSYLLHHAEADPDTALLSINTIQKSLSDTSPRVRAMALKTMAGVRIPLISQIVSLAIKKGTADMSPIVRKAAAFACVKCVKLDPATLPQVTEYLSTLLGDKQYFVAGAAVAAFSQICPERLDLIHPHYRSLVKKLVDMDEWGQVSTLQLLTVYARNCFPQRSRRVRKTNTQAAKQKGFYDDDDAEEEEVEYEDVQTLDPDLDLLLTSSLPLLQSRTSAVVVAVTRTYLYLAPDQYLHHAIGPLTALLRGPPDINQIGLHNIVQICLLYPQHFVPHFRHFLLRFGEGEQTWRLKLEILTLVFPHCVTDVQGLILTELEHFSQGHDPALVRESVRAIGRCAHNSDATTSSRCLRLLLRQIHSPDQHLVAEALEVIRHMIQRDPLSHTKTVIRLAKNLDTLTSPAARASIIWLVGEFAGYSPDQSIAPDVLRILVRGYPEEHDLVRQQIVLLAAKVYLHWLNAENATNKKESPPALERQSSSTVLAPDEEEDGAGFRDQGFNDENLSKLESQEDKSHPISLLYHHTLLLARYTPSYDLRDRARMFRALLAVPSSTELASLLLLAPKPVPQAPSPSESRKGYMLGSASLVIGEDSGVNGLSGYTPLPDWVKDGEEPDAKLRNVEMEAKTEYRPSGSSTVPAGRMLDDALKGSAPVVYKSKSGAPAKEKTLDDWLDEEEESSEEETDDSEDEEGSDEDEEEEETDDDDEEEEDSSEEESESDDGDEKRRLVD
jgi:AP-3 complex subunit beta